MISRLSQLSRFLSFIFCLLSFILPSLSVLPFAPNPFGNPEFSSQIIFISLVLISFFFYLVSLPKDSIIKHATASRIILSFSFFTLIALFSGLFSLRPLFSLTTKQFTLINTDSLLPTLSWLSLFLFFFLLLRSKDFGLFKKKWFLLFFLLLSFLDFLSYLINLNGSPRLSLSNSFQIAVSEISRNPFLGSGPGQFLTAYLRFRPWELNTVTFTHSGSELLEILTTTGLLGLGSFVLFLILVIKFLVSPEVRRLYLLSFIFLSIFFPLPLYLKIIWVMLLTLLITNAGDTRRILPVFEESLAPDAVGGLLTPQKTAGKDGGWQDPQTKKLPIRAGKTILFVILATFDLIFLLLLFRLTLAQYNFQKALLALQQNQWQEAYQKNVAAISFFPYSDTYHLTLSQISLTIANSLSISPPAGGFSDQDKTLIQNFLAQAVKEAKLAVTFSPQKAQNYLNLGIIYKGLVNIASDAERFSLAAFREASQLDPLNPQIPLEIGGVYFLKKDYENATKFFIDATLLNPNFANAFYNLALAQKNLGQKAKARENLEKALHLVKNDSQDFSKIKLELNQLE